MIELYTAATSNGRRVSIMLEETGLDYRVQSIDLRKGEQYQREFLTMNPAHGIPVIVDFGASREGPLILSQSVAILIYLAEKTNSLIPENSLARAKMFQWLLFDATDITQVRLEAGRMGWNDQKEAAGLLNERVLSRYVVLDTHLQSNQYLAGDTYSIADISAYPWAYAMGLKGFPHIKRWLQDIGLRLAVQKGMTVPV